jgi:hypothetical protein
MKELNPWARKFCSTKCENAFNLAFYWGDSWIDFRVRVRKRDRNQCVKCGKEVLDSSRYACDHIIPLFKGGRDWWEDFSMSNFQTLCNDCHAKKTAMDLAVPDSPKEKAKLVSLGFIFEIPKDSQLDKFMLCNSQLKKEEK